MCLFGEDEAEEKDVMFQLSPGKLRRRFSTEHAVPPESTSSECFLFFFTWLLLIFPSLSVFGSNRAFGLSWPFGTMLAVAAILFFLYPGVQKKYDVTCHEEMVTNPPPGKNVAWRFSHSISKFQPYQTLHTLKAT